MKVLMINGSPKANGNTALALNVMAKAFEEQGVEAEILRVGHRDVRGCVGCGQCAKLGHCAFDDVVNEALPKLEAADGVVLATPVYYASANGTLTSFCDRLFYANRADLTMKVGASVAVCRRGGASATFDQLNKYFTISGMPIAASCYWNSVHGGAPGEAAQDGEGLYTMRLLARNMAFLMKSIALGKEQIGLPEKEPRVWTNFIR